jgi:hypothetical protein
MALTLIGADRIISIDDDVTNAKILKAIYDQALASVLAEHPWNFALKRALLAQLAAAPAHGWTYQYQLPADYIRKVTVYNGVSEDDKIENDYYQIEGGVLLTDETTVYMKYIYLNTDSTKYSTKFDEALAAKLAAMIAFPIANDKNLAKLLADNYAGVLHIAQGADAQENPDTYLAGQDYFLDERV